MAVESRDLSQADKSIMKMFFFSMLQNFNFWILKYTVEIGLSQPIGVIFVKDSENLSLVKTIFVNMIRLYHLKQLAYKSFFIGKVC